MTRPSRSRHFLWQQVDTCQPLLPYRSCTQCSEPVVSAGTNACINIGSTWVGSNLWDALPMRKQGLKLSRRSKVAMPALKVDTGIRPTRAFLVLTLKYIFAPENRKNLEETIESLARSLVPFLRLDVLQAFPTSCGNRCEREPICTQLRLCRWRVNTDSFTRAYGGRLLSFTCTARRIDSKNKHIGLL